LGKKVIYDLGSKVGVVITFVMSPMSITFCKKKKNIISTANNFVAVV
jgi:hypothetical protein